MRKTLDVRPKLGDPASETQNVRRNNLDNSKLT